jgi:tRNA pseudouridine32 synthase/23S rRNA pseudouridine746 synthase/23S rRNA pseudouridine955/2504/2580 synthase
VSEGEPIRVLHEDSDLVVVDKPAGLLTIPGRGPEPGPDVHHLLEGQRGERLWVVHRLDRGTSGALVFARNAAAHRTLSQAFEAGRVGKRYLALVQGAVGPDAGEIDRALVPARRGKMRPASPGEEGKASRTRFQVQERFGRYTLLALEPETGRQHQIRVHLTSIGHPLAVDETYRGADRLTAADVGGEGDAVVLDRTPLHCQRLSLPLARGRAAVVEAPLPADLERTLALLRGTEVTDPVGIRVRRD